jgi:GalNAc5-diNAcBac-PP-undecaprenol beta-1,3-glucosyltransferase
LASGRYIMFLDDDDAWQPGLLARLTELQEIREDKFVYFDCSIITESRRNPKLVFDSEPKADITNGLNELVYVRNQVHMSCCVFPRRLIGDTRFDPSMRAYEDWDFQLAIFRKEMPQHVFIQGSIVFEVTDDSTDRRGSSEDANNFHAVMDYVYVYRRHPAPSETLRQQRADLMRRSGMTVPADML